MFLIKPIMSTAALVDAVEKLSDSHYNGYKDGNRRLDSDRNPVWTNERIDRQELIEAVYLLTERVHSLESSLERLQRRVDNGYYD